MEFSAPLLLVRKLNDACRKTLFDAASLCLQRTNYVVELEHWLIKLVEAPSLDLVKILRQCEVDPARLMGDMTRALERLKTGNSRTDTQVSPLIDMLIEKAWLLASVEYGANKIRSGHLVLALVTDPSLAPLAYSISRAFGSISAKLSRENLVDWTAGSIEEEAHESSLRTAPSHSGPLPSPQTSSTPVLDQFTIDLTARAREGQIDPVLGRDFEIRQVVDILMRRRQNNPILTGEAGVGKTAIAEGFALRVAKEDVPPPLRSVAIRTLDLGLLQAGAGLKGEFENRLKGVIEEVKKSPQPIILFIDEAHTMIGAGGQAGQSDAANLLKPALARGELRTIAATTWAEYKKYFEKDAALARRFQVVKVEEPNEEQALIMMRGLTESLENYHKVRVLEEAIEAAVKLSLRYVTGRQLPDKSVSVLDTACARVAIGLAATPAAIEDAERRISQLTTEIAGLERETATGTNHQERLAKRREELHTEEERQAKLQAQWEREKALVEQIRDLRTQLEEQGLSGEQKQGQEPIQTEKRAALQQLNQQLEQLQGEQPLMQVCVTAQTVAEVVSGWTGIPVGRMLSDEIKTVLSLRERLEQRVIGQSYALETISKRIRTSRANLTDPRRPIGVFLLIGPSGVGKTETALALADALYGGERNLITINMSEYKEKHEVSLLRGAPPGYVGYGQGGVLTEAVRRKPYSVVLLDEVEKAHPEVMELFYQVFDKGMLEDSEGRDIDFKNTLILLTSNVGSDTIMKYCGDPDTIPDPQALTEALRPELLKLFKPALLGRMVVAPYYPISDAVMRSIIILQLARLGRRLAENRGASFTYTEAVVDTIASRCHEVESGARNVDHIVTGTLMPEIADQLLTQMLNGSPITKVQVSVDSAGQFCYDMT